MATETIMSKGILFIHLKTKFIDTSIKCLLANRDCYCLHVETSIMLSVNVECFA